MSEIIQFSDFRFASLHRYMIPFYDSVRVQFISSTDKEKFLTKTIREFFKRIRSYRELSCEHIANASKSAVSLESLIEFESGKIRCSREIEAAYCNACGAYSEFEYFFEHLRAVKDPSIREGQNAVARDALKRFGIKMPLVDYQNLNAERGKVLELKR